MLNTTTRSRGVRLAVERWARLGAVILAALLPCAGAAHARQCGDGWALTGIVGPPTAAGATMVYDSLRDKVVLAGGSDGSTWLFDGVAWSIARPPGTGPTSGIMAFDAGRGVVVLYAGMFNLTEATWEWNGSAWSIAQVSGVEGVAGSSMDYFPPMGQVVRWGGRHTNPNCGPPLCPPTLYPTAGRAWNGTAWVTLGQGPGLASLDIAYDPTLQRLLRCGGFSSQISPMSVVFDRNTSAWHGPPGAWAQIVQGPASEPETDVQMYFDSARNEMRRLRAGISRLNGAEWQMLTDNRPVGEGAGSPVGNAVWDGGRQRLMAVIPTFVGSSQTWVWDGLPTAPAFEPPEYGMVRATLGGQMRAEINPYGATNLTYQWYRDGMPLTLGQNHVIRADSLLIVSPFACEDIGAYHVVMSNACGEAISGEWTADTAWLNAPTPAYGDIATQVGDIVTLRVNPVNATGATYRWRLDGVPLVDGGNVTGAFTNQLRIASPTCAQYGVYDAVVTSACGQTRTSGEWSVVPHPTFFAAVQRVPVNNPVREGQAVTLLATITRPDPGPFTWSWTRGGQPVVNGPNISGATTSTLQILSAGVGDSGVYQAFMTSACSGLSGVSAEVLIDVWCRGDTNNDRIVNFGDLNTVLAQFGQFGPPGALSGDVTGNGLVNFDDLNIVLANFGLGC